MLYLREATSMKLWRYILLACLLLSGCSFNPSASPATTSNQVPTAKAGNATAATIGPVPTAEADQQLQALWKQLDQGAPPANKPPISWKQAYSILFPSEWPPTQTT